MCNCMVNNDVGRVDFSLVRGILHVCGRAHMQSHVSQGMDCLLLKRSNSGPKHSFHSYKKRVHTV